MTAEENIQEAFELAEIKDRERAEAIKNGTAKDLPPLHGIPISIKDYVNLGPIIFEFIDLIKGVSSDFRRNEVVRSDILRRLPNCIAP